MCSAAATTDDDAEAAPIPAIAGNDTEAAPIPAIDLDEILDADFLASLAASLEGSDSSDSLMGSGSGSV